MRILAAALLGLLGLSACSVVAPMSAAARAQETATDLNTNTRFGRLELATENVDASNREKFLAQHKLWGNAIRIADYEMAGFKIKDNDYAETLVTVSWYRVKDEDLHNTIIRQKWKQIKGDWRLQEEARAEGDSGLLGDAPEVSPSTGSDPNAPKKPSQFPTIHLGSTVGAADADTTKSTVD